MNNQLPENTREVIEPYLPKIYEWINTGMQHFIENDSKRNAIFEKRTRANMIRDYIKFEVIKESDGDKKIHLVKKGNLFLFIIDQKVAIKIKKLNSEKLSVGRATKQMELFRSNAMEIPGLMERPKCLDAGYIPNEFWSGHKGIFITCRAEKWHFEIVDAGQIRYMPQITKEDNKKRTKVKHTKIIDINAAGQGK